MLHAKFQDYGHFGSGELTILAVCEECPESSLGGNPKGLFCHV